MKYLFSFITCLWAISWPGHPLQAANYFVATNGADANPGSEASPWRTIQKAANSAGAGDLILIMPGNYPERTTTRSNGTASARITFKASPGVTNWGFVVKHDYITIDGFDITGDGFAPNFSGAIDIYNVADHCYIYNNYIHDFPVHNGLSNRFSNIRFNFSNSYSNSSQSCIVSNNVFFNTTYTMLTLYGANHLVISNRFDTSNERDALIIFGRGHHIRGNLITNLNSHPIIQDHTDVMQTFGNEDVDSYDILFENNFIINCQAQIGQLEQKGRPNIRNWTMRNNIYINVGMACNIDIENMHWFNNTFIRCTTNTSGPLLLNCNIKGCANGAVIMNNIFYECGRNPESRDFGWYHTENTNVTFTANYNFVCGRDFAAKNPLRFTEANGINGGNPVLFDLETGKIWLAPGSPLIDKGANLSTYGFTKDIQGITRGFGLGWDIGAYEYWLQPAGILRQNP